MTISENETNEHSNESYLANASSISVNNVKGDSLIDNLSLGEEEIEKGKEEKNSENFSDKSLESKGSLESKASSEDVQLIEDYFGSFYFSPSEIIPIKRFTWITKNKLKVQLITYGATITNLEVPDRYGRTLDIVLGFNEIGPFVHNHKYHLGSTIGRVVNIIKDGSFKIGSDIHVLTSNLNDHHYNGGNRGFDKVIWNWHVEDKVVTLSYLSLDGDEGYPGSLLTHINYKVTADNTIEIRYKSTTSKPTPVNITNNMYFNLAGHNAGRNELYNHIVTINADKYTPVTEELLPTGEKLTVGGTLFDFRIPKILSDVLPLTPGNSFDTNFCLTKGNEQELSFASRVLHPKSGRVLELYSDQPGLQFDTANHLPEFDSLSDGSKIKIIPPIKGKNGASYEKHGGLCLKSQAFPNAMNQKRFPKVILYPGNEYSHNIVMKFGLQLGKYL